MDQYLENKVVLVTGGSRGIGNAIAVKTAQAGAKVAICARSRESLDKAVAQLQQITPDILGIQTDVSQSKDVTACIKQINDAWGAVDILINNAGIYRYAGILENSTEDWDAQFAVNLKGPFLMTHAVVPGMKAQKSGTIIFISSMVAVMSIPQHSCYSATKWGLDGFAGSIGQELCEYGIKVHTLRPGMTDTSIFDEIGKPDMDIDWIEPEEIADAVDFLLRLPKHAQVPELNYTSTAHRKEY
jgi:NADP-dependent 3-hydroxy acid dehydrogenase YdfG